MALMLLLVVVSNVKQALLREPFVFQDFEFFTDMLRHPRLYIPFFGTWRAVAGVVLFGLVTWSALILEPSIISRVGWAGMTLALAASLLLSSLLLARASLAMSFEPVLDLNRHGFLACLWSYGWAEQLPVQPSGVDWSRLANALPKVNAAPHLVLVQSESFFDARRVHEGIAPDLFAWWDRFCADSHCHGRLDVPAWGANTVRSEFATLSGIASADLGVHRFNPYRKLDAGNLSTLPRALRQAGYRTLCVHPYPADFYRRDKIFPLLGFDEFIDIRSFMDAPRCGPYVSDLAVGERVAALLERAGAPLFIFVITMENHGPLHHGQGMKIDDRPLYRTPPPSGFDELTVFLHHIQNAGRMCSGIQAALKANGRPGWLCWYGDHVPIMPEVYQATGFEDASTDFFIWFNGEDSGIQSSSVTLRADELGARLLAAAAQQSNRSLIVPRLRRRGTNTNKTGDWWIQKR
ncbi:MAG: LTA synthase family protein [Gammaproteobacteria bacterium]|nr:LTA synthase family protein [Gammaproteobacteria bacterium]